MVLEFLGPCIPDVFGWQYPERLWGALAKTAVQQALTGLAYLHKHDIGHGGSIIPEPNFRISAHES